MVSQPELKVIKGVLEEEGKKIKEEKKSFPLQTHNCTKKPQNANYL